MSFRIARGGVIGAFLVILFAMPTAFARDWKPDASALARDYAIIEHNVSPTEFVIIMWMVPPIVDPNVDGAAEVQRILEEYAVFGMTHIEADPNGLLREIRRAPPIMETFNGERLKELPINEIPPVPKAVIDAFSNVFSQNFGAFGQYMRWFVFEGGPVSACNKRGGMFVVYNGENYRYDTPFPGC